MRLFSFFFIALFLFSFCGRPEYRQENTPEITSKAELVKDEIQPVNKDNSIYIHTTTLAPEELVTYAESLTGIPYKYGSTDPKIGFDCSGFITYVFNHFNIIVPRSSDGFTNVEREIRLKDAKRGDIILFTGTDSTIHVVGHMGIITSASGRSINFIHSTSGKAYSVTTTPLNAYYQGRFVKVLRIFKQNDTY